MRTGTTTQVVLDTVRSNPGIHFRGLQRRAGLPSAGQLRHHIDRLVREEKVIEAEDGGFRRYFESGAYDRRLLQDMLRLSRPMPRRLARLLLDGRMSRTDIRRRLRCPDSTLGYYLVSLRDEGVLVRQAEEPNQFYELADPDHVRRILGAHPEDSADDGMQLISPMTG